MIIDRVQDAEIRRHVSWGRIAKESSDPKWLAIYQACKDAVLVLVRTGEISTRLTSICGSPAQRLNVTLRRQGRILASMSGDGEGLGMQLHNAVNRACLDTRFGGVTTLDAEDLTVELWVQIDRKFVASADRAHNANLVSGLFGAEVEWSDASAYYKPSVALTSDFSKADELLSALCQKAELFADAWKYEACQVWQTSWVHICESGQGRAAAFYNGLRQSVGIQDVSAEAMQHMLRIGTGYLINSQSPSGGYRYIYDAINDGVPRKKENIVRAAGCAYAMARVLPILETETKVRVSESAARAISSLLSRLVYVEPDCAMVREEGEGVSWGKLGSSALLSASLLCYGHIDGQYADVRNCLLNLIRRSQRGDGTFRCYLGIDRADDTVINFYPGEALVSLAMSVQQGDLSDLDYCSRAFHPYRNHFRRSPSSAFVGWHVDAWSRLAIATGNEEYAEFALEQANWMLNFQHTSSPESPIHGAFQVGGQTPGASSIVYTEAIIHGAYLAQTLGDYPLYRRLRKAALAGLRYCMTLQIDTTQAPFLGRPEMALGGVTGNARSFLVRSDNVQHSLTMAAAALASGLFEERDFPEIAD